MNRMWTRIAALAGVLAPSLATATLLIDDGGMHSINSPTPQSVRVSQGSEVHIGTGAVISGDGSNRLFSPSTTNGAIAVEVPSNSTIRISGNAQVSSGSELNAIARTLAGNLFIAGSSIINGNVYGVGFNDYSSLRTFISGDSRINGHLDTDGLVSISDNALITGHLFEANGGIALRMDGGEILGNVRSGSLVSHSAIIQGGTIHGSYGGNASDIDFSMHGGELAGRWGVNSFNQQVNIFGGQLAGGMEFGGIADDYARDSRVSIFGGAIDAMSGDYLFDFNYGFDDATYSASNCGANTSSFDIWGGQLGYASAGLGLHLDYCATIDVYGRNLNYSGGWLTGQLADGSMINLAVNEESRWGGSLRLHDVSVPEPGTLGLLGMALGAMAMARRRRVKDCA
ncbi:MAG TPA: PEP-CTERM sorting domain-containing protein [Steroidobacteraceae bacterium]|nr:PEP-CTERM sorting domain-containing protein [Steroidobacteraceae bacterium]